MPDVSVQPSGSEQTPPIAFRQRGAIHHANISQVGVRLAPDIKENGQQHPDEATPVKKQTRLKHRLPPTPVAIFPAIEFDHGEGFIVVSR